MPVNGCDNGDVFSRNSHISLEGLLFSAGPLYLLKHAH